MLKRELELKNLIESEKIDIMFVTETDTKLLKTEDDYKIKGRYTVIPEMKNTKEQVRIICIVEESMKDRIKVRKDLMSPSIWLEVERWSRKNVILGGFYREWT